MGTIIYLIIGIALLTYSSVRQYQRDKQDFMKRKFRYWLWWVVTIGCVLLWPIILVWALYDAVCIVKDLYNE